MAKSGFYQSNTVTEETTTALSSTTDFDDTGKAKSSFFATNEEYQATTDSGTAVDAAEAAQAYAEEWANKAEDSLVSAAAGGDQVDDYSALHHAAKAAADAILTAADLVLTNADVVLTGLDVVSTNADVVTTNANVVLTGLDVVATNADVVTTNADVVLTGLDVAATNADVVTTNADVVLTGLDVVATNADVVTTNADVVLTNADVVLTGLDVGYAQEWAIAVEDTPVSVAAGGDASTTFSALHWAAKAAATAATVGTFGGLTDVTITSIGTGELVVWNGSAWVNQTLDELSVVTLTGTQTLTNKTVTAPTLDTYFDVTPTSAPSHTEGRVYYDSTEKALSYYNDEADVTLNIGQESFIRCRNTTGVTITNGQAVYISGATGANLPNISLAQADALDTARCIGLATHDIENNSNGYVTTLGLVRDVDTSSYTAGNPLFLSTSTPGALTTTRPTTGYAVMVGYCTVSNVSVGEIKVLPGATVQEASLLADGDIGVTVQAYSEVLNDLDTLGAAASDGQFIVATGVGAFAYESGATARTSLGVYSTAETDSAIAAAVTAEDLDITGDTGTIAIDLDSEVLSFTGGTGITTTAATNDVSFAIDSTVATLTGSQTLTNKTIDLASNTVTMTQAQLDAAVSDGNVVYTDDIGVSVQGYDADTVKYDVAGAFTTDQDFQAQLEISEELLIDGLISPSQITSNQNDYAPTGIGTSNVVRVDSDAARSITGLSASQAEGRVIVIQNDGSYAITFPHEDTNSTAANRFDLSNDQDFSLDAGGAALFLYDGTASRWRLIGGGGGGSVSLSDTAPASPAEGNIWVRTTDFAGFVYYNDGSSSQWVQFAGGGGGFPNVWYDNVDANTYNLTDVGDLIAGTPTALSFVNGSGTTASPAIQAIGASFGPASIGAARFTATSASGYLMFLKSRNATIGSHTIVQDGDDLGRIPFAGSDGTNFVPGAEIQAEVDGTPGTNDMPGRFVFRTTADGASTTTERIRIPSTGGISFDSGTNSLDTYEEGTWTPTIEGSTTNPTVTYDTQTGNYTKVGNICTASFSVDLATYSGGSGFLWLNGLPFNCAGDANVYGVAFTFVQNLNWGTGDTMICAHVENNNNFFYWYGQTNNSGANIVSVGDASASTTLAGTVTYRTA